MPPSATSEKGSAPGQATFRFRCIGCGSVNASAAQDFRCSDCGNLLEITDSSWNSRNPTALKTQWRERRTLNESMDLSGVWRFRKVLCPRRNLSRKLSPCAKATLLCTNFRNPRASRACRTFNAKHQGLNPTGSFKDTGMTVAATFARQAGYRWVACASTGNTSASMAAYAARGGMRSLVLVPEGNRRLSNTTGPWDALRKWMETGRFADCGRNCRRRRAVTQIA